MKRIIELSLSLILLFSITLTSCAEGSRLSSESNSIGTTNTVVSTTQTTTVAIPESITEIPTMPVTEESVHYKLPSKNIY